jgi:hypothetical protein
LCRELVEEEVVDECWKQLEFGRIMEEIMKGDTDLKRKVEHRLRDSREMMEATEAMLAEEAVNMRRMEKVERLKIAWKKRMEARKYELMLEKLSKLTLLELEKDMMEIERLVRNMVIMEAGEAAARMNIIDTEDVVMVTVTSDNLEVVDIKWTDEQMDIVTKEYTEQEDMMRMAHSGEEVETDIDIRMVQEEYKEDTVTLMDGHLPGGESVVGVESYSRYPHHYGGGHTPLLRPVTITEKGVELGCVIGLPTTGDQGEVDNVMVELEDGDIKYCPGMGVVLPSYTFRGYKAHCSKICPDRIRYNVLSVTHRAAHTPQLETYISTESTGVQSHDQPTDLIKVGGYTTGTNLEKSEDMSSQAQIIPTFTQKTAHTPQPGTSIIMDRDPSEQYLEHTADLLKVGGVTRNMSLEKSPGMVAGRMERFCDIGKMICQWEEMEGEGLESGREERDMRKGRRVSRRISELMRSFQEGGGSELVKLDTGNNDFRKKENKDTQLSYSLSSEDIQTTIVGFSFSSSNHIGTDVVSKENRPVSEGADWLNNRTSTKLTANRKPGGEKRKRDGSIESENDGIMLTKKRRGGN